MARQQGVDGEHLLPFGVAAAPGAQVLTVAVLPHSRDHQHRIGEHLRAVAHFLKQRVHHQVGILLLDRPAWSDLHLFPRDGREGLGEVVDGDAFQVEKGMIASIDGVRRM